MENEKPMIERLINFNRKLKKNNKIMNSENKGYSRNEFYNLMKLNGISSNSDLINKLFWIFDENGDDNLKIKELALGLELFTESPFEEKLRVFFDLCDEDDSGLVSKSELMNILRNNLINNEEKAGVKNIIDKIFAYYNLDDKAELTL